MWPGEPAGCHRGDTGRGTRAPLTTKALPLLDLRFLLCDMSGRADPWASSALKFQPHPCLPPHPTQPGGGQVGEDNGYWVGKMTRSA